VIDPRIGCKVLVSVKRMVLCFAEFFFQSSSVFTIGYLGGITGLNLNNFHSDAHGHGQLSLRLHDLHPNGHRFCRSDLVEQQYYWERAAVQLVRTRGSSGHSRQLPHSLLNSGSTPRIFIGLQGHTDTLAPQRHC